MTVQGKLHKKFDTQQIKETFKKREFVIEYNDGNPMYPQYVLFQLIQDKCNLIDNVAEGSEVSVDFNLRGRSWQSPNGETKYFNSLDAWRVSPVQQFEAQGNDAPPTPPAFLDDAIDGNSMEADDLPF
ncbi:MAG: DUF3127 domain-containing protein [Bacteroidia bacterium]|nr:DUF3127 domain-containing protein [Bacteroidia bacterium]